MSYNVPDDWGLFYGRCDTCGDRTHASEGHACSCQDEQEVERISERYTVCSLTGDVKLTEIFKNAYGGVDEYVVVYPYDFMKRKLSENQIKYRNDLIRRLK